MTFKACNFASLQLGLWFLSCIAGGCGNSPAHMVEIREAAEKHSVDLAY